MILKKLDVKSKAAWLEEKLAKLKNSEKNSKMQRAWDEARKQYKLTSLICLNAEHHTAKNCNEEPEACVWRAKPKQMKTKKFIKQDEQEQASTLRQSLLKQLNGLNRGFFGSCKNSKCELYSCTLTKQEYE